MPWSTQKESAQGHNGILALMQKERNVTHPVPMLLCLLANRLHWDVKSIKASLTSQSQPTELSSNTHTHRCNFHPHTLNALAAPPHPQLRKEEITATARFLQASRFQSIFCFPLPMLKAFCSHPLPLPLKSYLSIHAPSCLVNGCEHKQRSMAVQVITGCLSLEIKDTKAILTGGGDPGCVREKSWVLISVWVLNTPGCSDKSFFTQLPPALLALSRMVKGVWVPGVGLIIGWSLTFPAIIIPTPFQSSAGSLQNEQLASNCRSFPLEFMSLTQMGFEESNSSCLQCSLLFPRASLGSGGGP